jgi:purine-binding chemotaxis protein CheW
MNAAQTLTNETLSKGEDDLDQYLTFMLADEEYGLDILRVQEIKGWDGVTPMPGMPAHILGVINLRGTVVPIINLRTLFELETVPFLATTVVIVVRVNDAEVGERTMGIVVDAVSEVHNIAKADLNPAPDFGGACSSDFIKGLATQNKQMIIMLDIDRLMNDGVLHELDGPSQSSTAL